jgi:hypothetical protein
MLNARFAAVLADATAGGSFPCSSGVGRRSLISARRHIDNELSKVAGCLRRWSVMTR